MKKTKTRNKRAFLGGLFGGKPAEPTRTPMNTALPVYLRSHYRHHEGPMSGRFDKGPWRESTLGEYLEGDPIPDDSLWNVCDKIERSSPPSSQVSALWDNKVGPLVFDKEMRLRPSVTFGQLEDAIGPGIGPLDDYWKRHLYGHTEPVATEYPTNRLPKTAALFAGINGTDGSRTCDQASSQNRNPPEVTHTMTEEPVEIGSPDSGPDSGNVNNNFKQALFRGMGMKRAALEYIGDLMASGGTDSPDFPDRIGPGSAAMGVLGVHGRHTGMPEVTFFDSKEDPVEMSNRVRESREELNDPRGSSWIPSAAGVAHGNVPKLLTSTGHLALENYAMGTASTLAGAALGSIGGGLIGGPEAQTVGTVGGAIAGALLSPLIAAHHHINLVSRPHVEESRQDLASTAARGKIRPWPSERDVTTGKVWEDGLRMLSDKENSPEFEEESEGHKHKKASGAFPSRLVSKIVPMEERRDNLEPEEEHEVSEGKEQWHAPIFQHEDTPIASLMASPAKHGLLTGIAGAIGGGTVVGGLTYALAKHYNILNPERLAIRGALHGALAGGVAFDAFGHHHQTEENAHLEESIRRLPPGSTKRDLDNENMLTKSLHDKFAAYKPGLAASPQGYDALEGALGFYDAARSLARPTDSALRQAGLNRDKFNKFTGSIADQLSDYPPSAMNQPYSVSNLKRDPNVVGGVSAGLGAAAGLGAGMIGGAVGDVGLLGKAGLTVAGGVAGWLAGSTSAKAHNADLVKTMKVLRNYGMSTPVKVMRAMPVVSDSKYDQALARGLKG